ncbi:hypothetical protein ABZ729_15570 [Streptomyces sp. NPDC006678]|uniref:hypothetical protein n=1 Tax=unclassified Streptomyces TaxID=2593676 RepID=UPI0033AB7B96
MSATVSSREPVITVSWLLQVADQVAVIVDGAGAETMTTMSSESAFWRGRM